MSHADDEHPAEGLLLRTVALGDSDLLATFFMRRYGKISAIAHGARNSRRRFGGSLEPFHVLAVRADKRREMWSLREVFVSTPRLAIGADLAAIGYAGTALRLVRDLCPAGAADENVYVAIDAYLSAVNAAPSLAGERLPRFGFALLRELGYELHFDACAVCGKPLPEGRPACFDVARGGVVCRACGGGPRILSPEVLGAATAASDCINVAPISAELRAELQAIVDDVVRLHAQAT